MNSKERIFAALEHKYTDKVPVHHLGMASKIASEITGKEIFIGGGLQQFREAQARFEGEDAHRKFMEKSFLDAMEVARVFDMDLVRVTGWRELKKPSKKIDDLTFRYDEPDGSYVVKSCSPEQELYQTVQTSSGGPEKDLAYLEKFVEEMELNYEKKVWNLDEFQIYKQADDYFKGERAVYGAGAGLHILYEPPVWFEATLLRPQIVERFLDLQVKTAVKQFELYSKLGIKILLGGGNCASTQAPFFSPDTVRALLLPRIKKIVSYSQKIGSYFIYGSAGNLWPIADILFKEGGIRGLYEVDRIAGMDLKLLREKYPMLTLQGNISSITLHQGSKEDVYKETMDNLKTAKKLGSIIVGVSNAIVPETPVENVEMMLETIRKHNI